MAEAIGFFIWLALGVSILVILVLFVIPVALFMLWAVLAAIQDAWGEVVRHFRAGR